jgi:hypothetical protein
MNAIGDPAVAYTKQRIASLASAIPLTTDKSVIEAIALMATALESQIKLAGNLIRTYYERIESYSIRFRMQNCSNHFLEWDCVWGQGCLPHWVITATASTAPKNFKTTLTSRL